MTAMILEKLSIIELEVKYNIYLEQNKLKAIRSIRELLGQIDFEVEVVPTDDIEKLSELLNSLKGRTLNEEEIELLRRLIG
jgi:hypothetical protein